MTKGLQKQIMNWGVGKAKRKMQSPTCVTWQWEGARHTKDSVGRTTRTMASAQAHTPTHSLQKRNMVSPSHETICLRAPVKKIHRGNSGKHRI